jgi:hypothetical protein
MAADEIPQPWGGFLTATDRALSGPVDLHCLGSFVVSVCYGLARPTADLDVFSIFPDARLHEVLAIAGKGSALARRHRVYIDYVTVVTVPENYAERVREIFQGRLRRLRLFAIDAYDVALAKLERNLDIDRDDVRFLARTAPLDTKVLRERYERELRPYLSRPEREDSTLDLWIEVIEEARAG